MNKILVFGMISLCFFSSCEKMKGETQYKQENDTAVWTEPVRLATYNIQYDNNGDPNGEWDNRKEILKQLLLQYDFDIFGAQEPYKEQIEDMASWLPGYAWTGVSVTGATDVERKHFNPIFYKKDRFEIVEQGAFWYSETPDVAGSKGWDSYSPRMCNWVHFKDLKTGKEFVHFNSHFDHKGTVAREESARLLVEKVKEIAGDLPAVCTADYNSNQKTEAYRIIVTSDRLADSYSRAEHRENDKWPTYNGYKYISTPPANATRIDHIFITKKNNKVQSWKIINDTYGYKYPSDHNPILIEWSFAE